MEKAEKPLHEAIGDSKREHRKKKQRGETATGFFLFWEGARFAQSNTIVISDNEPLRILTGILVPRTLRRF